MKIKSLLIAASLALTPATVAFADDAKKEALKKAKEKAIEAAKEAAKEKAKEKSEKAEKAAEKKATAAGKADEERAAAEKAENEQHSKNMGAIERLEQIAGVMSDEGLKTKVASLREKENKRHGLVMPAPAPTK